MDEKRYRTFVLAVLIGMSSPTVVLAHTTGASFEKQIGKYTVDIGYDTTVPQAGERLVLDFNLENKDTTLAAFDYVWVRISSDTETVLATGIHRADVGPTSLLFAIPGDFRGPLTINARFEKGENTLAETSFELPVKSTGLSPFFGAVLGAILGLVVGGGSVLVLSYRWRKPVV